MDTIRSDTFESGAALAANYALVHNCETNATCGRGGGWGCRCTGADPTFGYFRYDFTAVPGSHFRVSFDSDSSAVWGQALVFQALAGGAVIAELSRDAASGSLVLDTYWGSLHVHAAGALTPSTWQTLVMEVWCSTLVDEGGWWSPAADGRITVTVDGVSVIDETGEVITEPGYLAGANSLDSCTFGPMGNGDNLKIEYDSPDPDLHVLTIAGVEQHENVDTASVHLEMGARSTAKFRCHPGLIPTRFDQVVVYAADGVTPLFGGLVWTRHVSGVAPNTPEAVCDVDCVDFSVYGDWGFTSAAYGADVTLKTVLTDLVDDHLADGGITLDPTQPDGPTLTAFAFDANTKVSDAIRQLRDRTGYVDLWSPTKVLRMVLPGSDSAPQDITTENVSAYQVEWSDSGDAPANRIIMSCGPTGTFLARQLWIADGIATSWQTDFPAADPPPPVVEINDGTNPPYLATVGTAGDGMYEWDRATHTLSDGPVSHPTATPPPAGTRICLGPVMEMGDTYTTNGYTAQGPFVVVRPATGPTPPVIEARVDAPEIVTLAAAEEAADQALAKADQQVRTLSILTFVPGFFPAQALTVDVPERDLGDDYADVETVIAAVDVEIGVERIYALTCPEGSSYQGSAVDRLRAALGAG